MHPAYKFDLVKLVRKLVKDEAVVVTLVLMEVTVEERVVKRLLISVT